MDTKEELERLCKGLESRLAEMDEDDEREREYTVYDIDKKEIGVINVPLNADGDDIIEILVDEGFLKPEGDYSNVYDGKSDDMDVDETIEDDTNTILTLKTFDEIEDFDEFMDNVLDIERTQYLSGGDWETKSYTIVVSTGGPHVEFSTDYCINAYWGGEHREWHIGDDGARATIDRIEDYLNDVYYESNHR